MIFIDLEHKLPTDADLPADVRWAQADWDAWLVKSKELVEKLAVLTKVGKIEDRNKLIDASSAHWGKLKGWLSALSYGKCWFTEAPDAASHLDVEHFRPKKSARNIKGPERDGYWWLAFDFMNFRFAGTVPNRKKGVWFPLRYGSPVSSFAQRCEEDEAPYFLDPTNAHDVTLLAFDDEGKAVPMPGLDRWEEVRVRRTIQRLKLTDHKALAEERRKIWQEVSMYVNDYQRGLSRSRHSAAARELARISAREITERTKPSARFSAVAKWCVLVRNDHRLAKLVG